MSSRFGSPWPEPPTTPLTQQADPTRLGALVWLASPVFTGDDRQFFCHSAALVSDLPVQQGERNDAEELVEFFRFAAVLRLAAFATDAATSHAVIACGTRALGELVGRAPDELAALQVTDVVGSRNSGLAQCDLVEAELLHLDGRSVPVFLTVRQLGGELAPWVWLAFVREPTKRSVSTLAQQLVHEVSNPLTSVVCRLDLVGRQLPQVVTDQARGEDLGRHLATAQHGAERVITLVREFADSLASAPESREPVDVVRALSHALMLLEPDLEAVATIVCDVQPVPWVLGRASKLEQVLSNLLENALHAVQEASVPQDHRIRISVSSEAEWVVVGIEDTGVGMPESLLQQVFEPFVTTRAASGGTGLGLCICREVVEALGGKLEVKSSPLMGSRFRVCLRAVDEPPSGTLPPSSYRRSKRA